jgi:hypothetical protein
MHERTDLRLLQFVEAADWASMTPRLVGFAHFRLARHGRLAGPNGQTANDYVTRAVVEVLDAQHDASRARSLFALICAVIALRIRVDLEKYSLSCV